MIRLVPPDEAKLIDFLEAHFRGQHAPPSRPARYYGRCTGCGRYERCTEAGMARFCEKCQAPESPWQE